MRQLHRERIFIPIRQKKSTLHNNHKALNQSLSLTQRYSFENPELNQHVKLKRRVYEYRDGGMVSDDSPSWFPRNNRVRGRGIRQFMNQSIQADIFNNSKKHYQGRNDHNYFKSFKLQIPTLKTIQNPKINKQLTPKVGFSQYRIPSIHRPILKIGKTDYINTYSVF